MPAFVSAVGDESTGWVRLSFPFDKEIMAKVKALPGAKWGPLQGVPPGPWSTKPAQHKAWFVPVHSWMVLSKQIKSGTTWHPPRLAALPPTLADRLRPYQLEAAHRMVCCRAMFLTFDMRVGKTPTAITAACGMLGAGQADMVLIMCPAGVVGSWQDQLRAWAGVELHSLQSYTKLLQMEVEELRATPFLFFGCHYEILAEREECIARVAAGRRVIVIADEGHLLQNRKAKRSKTALRLSKGTPAERVGDTDDETITAKCDIVAWWMLSGTPMRNKPRNLWMPFELALPGSMSTYWTYAKRYCAAFEGDHGWVDGGVSNEQELAERLGAISIRKTRAEVAPWLPKADRQVIMCDVSPSQLTHYRQLEAAHASSIRRAIDNEEPSANDRAALEGLARATSEVKLTDAVKRIWVHANRGVKVVVFAHFKDTIRRLIEEYDHQVLMRGMSGPAVLPRVFDAGTYQGLSPTDRKEVIAAWKAWSGSAVLFANTLSSGIGIDLSAAEAAIFLELEWVPPDFRQAEDRIVDVHQGTRTTSPILEYLLVPGTIDEAMAQAILSKIRAIEAVVGSDNETSGLAGVLRGSGLISAANLGLPNNDKETVQAALSHLRDRLLGKTPKVVPDAKAELAARITSDWEEDESEDASNEDAEDSIPF